MKALNPIHKIVAREVALGFDLAEICRVRKLDYDAWKRVANGSLFKNEVERLSKEIEERMIQDAAEDPVTQTLKAGARSAAQALLNEIDNHDKEADGATASTRIAASKAILEFAGFNKKEDQRAPSVVINISSAKATAMKIVEAVSTQPESIIGVAYAG